MHWQQRAETRSNNVRRKCGDITSYRLFFSSFFFKYRSTQSAFTNRLLFALLPNERKRSHFFFHFSSPVNRCLFFLPQLTATAAPHIRCVDKDPIFHYCLHWYENEWETSCWQPAPWTSCINYHCARDKHHQNRTYRTTHSPISFAFNFNYFIRKECWTHKSGDWRPLIFSCSSNYLLLLLMLLRARDSFHQRFLRFALHHSPFLLLFFSSF